MRSIDPKTFYDVVVVGGGPAGLTAALYLARAKYRVVVVEKETFGGQITITEEVVNYPGVEKTSGKALTETMRKQAERFGAEFLMAEVTGLSMDEEIKAVHTSRGTLSCFGVLLATGAHPRKIGFSGEEEWKGRGVAYCATCDGEFFTGKEVFVVGGGFAAAEESVFLPRYASHVTLLIREDDFTCAEAVAEPARHHEKITVMTNVQLEEVSGDTGLHTLKYKDLKTGEVTEVHAKPGDHFGVFVFAGYEPETALVQKIADCDPAGYILTGRDQQTSCEGLYAAGDVCIKPLRQVVTAVGDGALAATEMERLAAQMQKKTGLKPAREEPPHQAREAMENRPQGIPKREGLFSSEMVAQLQGVFQRMQKPLTLKLFLNDTPVSEELRQYAQEMALLTDKLSVEIEADASVEQDRPCVRLYREDGAWTGLAFHGVPGGHEFTSFVLSLYNAAGPGQALDAQTLASIHRLPPAHLKVLVSLSCTMCPELVTAVQRIAAEHPGITAEVYDLHHFPALKDRYRVMSVPCLILGEGEKVAFGKKNVAQLLEWLSQNITD